MTDEEKKPQHCEKELAQFIRTGATRRPGPGVWRLLPRPERVVRARRGLRRDVSPADPGERPAPDEGSRMVLRLPRGLGPQVPGGDGCKKTLSLAAIMVHLNDDHKWSREADRAVARDAEVAVGELPVAVASYSCELPVESASYQFSRSLSAPLQAALHRARVAEHELRQRPEDHVVDLAALGDRQSRSSSASATISNVHVPPNCVSPTIFVTSFDGGTLSTTSDFTSRRPTRIDRSPDRDISAKTCSRRLVELRAARRFVRDRQEVSNQRDHANDADQRRRTSTRSTSFAISLRAAARLWPASQCPRARVCAPTMRVGRASARRASQSSTELACIAAAPFAVNRRSTARPSLRGLPA